MRLNPLAQAVDIIKTALKKFDYPFLSKNIKITKPTVSLEGNGERVELMFNTELVVSGFNDITHNQYHHLTIPKDSCNVPTITAMITSVLFDAVLNHVNNIASGKEGSSDEVADTSVDQKFIWNRKPEGVSSQWININTTLANACDKFNKRYGSYIDDLVKNPTLHIVKVELSPNKHPVFGYPLELVCDCVVDGQTHTASNRIYIPLGCFTTSDKLVMSVLVPATDKLFPHNVVRVGDSLGISINEHICDPDTDRLGKFTNIVRDTIQIYNNTAALNMPEKERVLFDVVDIREIGNSGKYILHLKMTQKGSESFIRKIKLDNLVKYTGRIIHENILHPLAAFAHDPIMFKRLAKEGGVSEHYIFNPK